MDISGIGALAFFAIFAAMGLVYLGYPALCILLGVIAASRLRKRWSNQRAASVVGLVLTIVFLSLPFADFPSIRNRFLKLCEQDGGVTVSRTVRDVDGVHGLENATSYGYSFGERFTKKSENGTVRRYFKPMPNSKAMYRIEDGTTVALYGYRFAISAADDDTTRTEEQTYVVETGEVLGRHVSYQRYPSQNTPGNNGERISINSFRPWLRMSCNQNGIGTPPDYTRELLLRTLIPLTKSGRE